MRAEEQAMARRITWSLAIGLLVAAASVASTPSGHKTGAGAGVDPSSVTESVKLTIRDVDPETNRIRVFDPETEEVHVIALSDKMRLTARRKKDFGGRRKLEFADLAAGQTVKVTYRTDDGRITSIQVLEPARERPA